MIYFVADFLVTPNHILWGFVVIVILFWVLASSILLSLSQILCSGITFVFLSSAISSFMEVTGTLAKEKK